MSNDPTSDTQPPLADFLTLTATSSDIRQIVQVNRALEELERKYPNQLFRGSSGGQDSLTQSPIDQWQLLASSSVITLFLRELPSLLKRLKKVNMSIHYAGERLQFSAITVEGDLEKLELLLGKADSGTNFDPNKSKKIK